MITRRNVILAASTGPLASLAAHAQRKVWRIGYLGIHDSSIYAPWIGAFKSGMGALGHVESQDYVVEIRSARADLARLSSTTAELIALKLDIVLTSSTATAIAAYKATRTTPILTTATGDPIGNGLAASLARPGGNVTGLTSISSVLYVKSLDLIRQTVAGLSRVGLLYNPDNSIERSYLSRFEGECDRLKLKAIGAPVRNLADIETAFQLLMQNKAQAVIVTNGSALSGAARDDIISRAAKHRLPAIYARSEYVEAGGLLSYGTDYKDLYRRAAGYADKIIKGARPGDLPIEQPKTFEFVLNMKAAQALGLKVSQAVQVQATRVIE